MDDLQKGEILIYQTEKGETKIDVSMEDSTIWLSQKQISQLYQKSVNTINEHIKNIYTEGELNAAATCNYYSQVQKEGDREVLCEAEYYNLKLMPKSKKIIGGKNNARY